MPSLHSLPFQGILIIMLSAGLTLIASSLVRQGFGYKQGYFLPFLSTDGNFGETGQVLSHIQHKGRRVHRPFG